MQFSGQYRSWLHRFTVLLAVATLFLVVAGASVTSKEAGLSVPDWPLSYGQVMPEMTGESSLNMATAWLRPRSAC